MDRRMLASVIGLVIAAVAVIVIWNADSAEPAADAVDVPFTYLDGTQGNLSDFVGTPVVVNFWASWCPACVAEMPDFAAVHRDVGNEVTFLGFNMQESDPAAAERLVDHTGVEYALAADPDGSIFRMFDGIAMPTTVFIAADGTIADVHAGVIFEEDLRERVEDLLAEART